MPPSHPEWAPVCPTPCLRYYCVAIYYHSVVGSPGHGQLVCPWHLARYLVGLVTWVLVFLPYTEGCLHYTHTPVQCCMLPSMYGIEVCSILCSDVYTHEYTRM